MSKSAVFPYGITIREGGRVDVFPAAQVLFEGKTGEWYSLFLVIDSGATISALPKGDASPLGIDAEGGVPFEITGIGGTVISGRRHDVSVTLGGTRLRLPVVFLDDDNVPRILGREGLFDRFAVVFEEYRKRSSFLGKNEKSGRAITKIIDKLNDKSQ